MLPALSLCAILLLSAKVFLVHGFSLSAGSNVRAFYYLWYGNPRHNGAYQHWNHEVLPHWDNHVNSAFPSIGKRFSPPEDLHSPFYPLLGPYSSTDPAVVKEHLRMLSKAQVNVLVVSWWGQRNNPSAADSQGVYTDEAVELLLRVTEEYNAMHPLLQPVQIAFHLEPYPARSVQSVREDIVYIHERYGKYSCLLRSRSPRPKGFAQKEKLVFYVYDSYLIDANQWQRLLYDEGDLSIRTSSRYDSVVFGLWLEQEHGRDLFHAGFDGIYTYFAVDGFSYGSTYNNWKSICAYCHAHQMLCDLSVGAGYDDSLIRPWNARNMRERGHGSYYKRSWRKAIAAKPDVISITSFNEWGEGTQIEPAVGKQFNGRTYQDYGDDPYLYTNITQQCVDQYNGQLLDEL